MSNGGRVAQVLADGLGVSIVELKKMGDEGKITSNVILQSLVGSLTKLRQEMALRPATLGDSLTVLKNALGEYIGRLAQSEGVTSTLGASVIFLADHIDTVAKGAASAAAIMLSAYVPALARAALAQTTVLATNPFLLMATASRRGFVRNRSVRRQASPRRLKATSPTFRITPPFFGRT